MKKIVTVNINVELNLPDDTKELNESEFIEDIEHEALSVFMSYNSSYSKRRII